MNYFKKLLYAFRCVCWYPLLLKRFHNSPALFIIISIVRVISYYAFLGISKWILFSLALPGILIRKAKATNMSNIHNIYEHVQPSVLWVQGVSLFCFHHYSEKYTLNYIYHVKVLLLLVSTFSFPAQLITRVIEAVLFAKVYVQKESHVCPWFIP